jgi:hypothetical protein
MIDIVMQQANCSAEDAFEALKESDFQLVTAIAKVTFIESQEDKERRERLEASVMADMTSEAKKKAEDRHAYEKIQVVLNNLFKHAQTYSITYQLNEQLLKTQLWYLPDEVGASIGHDNNPNVFMMPFMTKLPSGESITYNVFWPIKEIHAGDLITRDVFPKTLPESQRSSYLSVNHLNAEMRKHFQSALEKYQTVSSNLIQVESASPFSDIAIRIT